MAHVLFATFDSPQDATSAIAQLERELGRHDDSIVIHKRRLNRLPSSELALFETNMASMIWKFGLGGVVVGSIIGAIATLSGGPPGTFVFTGLAGLIAGVVTGLFAGPSSSDPMLKKLAAGMKRGGALVSVERSTLDEAKRAEVVLQSNSGRVVWKHLMSDPSPEEKRELERARARAAMPSQPIVAARLPHWTQQGRGSVP